jgi:outer membrane protein assembly factor BamB
MKIDPKQQGNLPRVDEPSEFLSPDGRFRGWRVTIPGGGSLATPAVVDGRVFLGGGFGSYYLACCDLRTGQEYWKQPIEGEIITAPVLAGGKVHFATLGGTLYCLRQEDGRVECHEPRDATSSPVVWEGECFFSQRQEVAEGDPAQPDVHQAEHLAARRMRDAAFRHYAGTDLGPTRLFANVR